MSFGVFCASSLYCVSEIDSPNLSRNWCHRFLERLSDLRQADIRARKCSSTQGGDPASRRPRQFIPDADREGLSFHGSGAKDKEAILKAIGGWFKEQHGFGLHPDQLRKVIASVPRFRRKTGPAVRNGDIPCLVPRLQKCVDRSLNSLNRRPG